MIMMMTLHGESCISGIPLVLTGLVRLGGANERSHIVGAQWAPGFNLILQKLRCDSSSLVVLCSSAVT